MNDRELTNRLEEAMSDVPDVFHNAMLGAFAQMQEQEALEQQAPQDSKVIPLPKPKLKKRTAAIILVAAMLMATAVGVAATVTPRILAYFWGENIAMQQDFPSMVAYQPAEEMIGDFRVRVDEAVYDGVSLYVTYSIRDMTMEQILGADDPYHGLSYEELLLIESWDVMNWADRLWLNGHEVDGTTAGSGGSAIEGGDEPGEITQTLQYRLDGDGVFLSGVTRVALPVGKRQNILQQYDTWPRAEDGTLMEPEEGCIVFNLNTDVTTERLTDGPHTVLEDGTEIWVKEAIFTPVKMYLTLNYNLPDELVDSYVEKVADEYRELFSETSLMSEEAMNDWIRQISAEDASEWITGMRLVDAQGHVCDAEMGYGDGIQGHGPTSADFIFPYMETYPSPLYIAPVTDGVADTTRMILIKE